MENNKRKIEQPLRRKVTLVPVGGLANRLRAVCSGIALALREDCDMEILWFTREEMYCPYHRLFTLRPDLEAKGITIREANWKDRLFNVYPNRNNLWLTTLPLLLQYDFFVSAHELQEWVENTPMRVEGVFKQNDWEHIIIYSRSSVIDERHMYHYIEPSVEVLQTCKVLMAGWSEDIVGLHIRRSHTRKYREFGSTELFIKTMQKMVEEDPQVEFFLATNSLDERERLKTIFSGRVFTPYTEPGRHTPEGIVDAFAEMLALSQTSRILATRDSTFSLVASKIGGIPYRHISIYSQEDSTGIYDTRRN